MECAWKRVAVAAIALFSILMSREVMAYGRTDLAHIHADEATRPPIGWALFCNSNPKECASTGSQRPIVSLTTDKLRELHAVNRYFNQNILPMTDYDQYGVIERWTYADTGRGDCEDYVLEKRRRLIQLGWPQHSLLITVVVNKLGEGHAVLTVVTEEGDFILDNLTDDILLWSNTGLLFVKRQSDFDPNQWLDLGRLFGRPESLTAATPR